MERTPRRDETLGHVFSPHENWVDRRPLKTLAWMMVGLMPASVVSRTAWAPSGHRRAVYAQSLGRRVDRWRQHQRIEGPPVSGPLIQRALAQGGTNARALALAPSPLWETYGLVRLALISHGRAIPLGWPVLAQPRRRVAYAAYAA